MESYNKWRNDLRNESLEICKTGMRMKINSIHAKWEELVRRPDQSPQKNWDEGAISIHQGNIAMIVELKDEIKDLLQMADTVLLYLTLQTPKTQSALPFYVEVQKQIANELGMAKLGCNLLLKVLRQYTDQRAEVIQQALKYPAVHDYKQSLIEFDASQAVSIKRWLKDLETTYTVLLDTITKNFDRIFNTSSSVLLGPPPEAQ